MLVDSLDYTIWTDGGCAVNPNGKGGYGVRILNNKTNEMTPFQQGFLSSTNNRMEVRAIIRALEEIPDGSSAVIYSDSKYAVDTFNGIYSKKKNLDLWPIADSLIAKKRNIIFEWVKGHANTEQNNLCDKMATDAQNGDNLIIDEGFVPLSKKSPKSANKGSQSNTQTHASINHTIPAMEKEIEPLFPDMKVKTECLQQIQILNTKEYISFSDFANVRVGGKDDWSVQSLDALKLYFGSYICTYFLSNTDNDTLAAAALRWYGRGLRAEYAVRKVYVDQEINRNNRRI